MVYNINQNIDRIRKPKTKIIAKGYNIFLLSDPEICNRLSLAFFPENSFPSLNYMNEELFNQYIFSSLLRHNITDDYYNNILKLYNGDAEMIKIEEQEKLMSGREKCICALKAYYENKDFLI